MQESKTKIYKENWLLATSFVLIILGVLGFFFLDTNALVSNSRSQQSITLPVLLLAGIIFAPLFEEFAFRGIFVNTKKTIWVSAILSTVFLAISYKNYYAIAIFILYVISYLMYRRNNSNLTFKIFAILNAVFFGVVHYKVDDFTSIEKGFIILFQISIGFLLIWVTINFNLLRSMIVHAVYNSIAFSFLLIAVQFPDTEMHYYEDENIKVEWQRTPYFQSHSSVSSSADSLVVKSSTVTQVYKIIQVLDDDDKSENLIPAETHMKYNLKIILKKDADKNIFSAVDYFLIHEEIIDSRQPSE